MDIKFRYKMFGTNQLIIQAESGIKTTTLGAVRILKTKEFLGILDANEEVKESSVDEKTWDKFLKNLY